MLFEWEKFDIYDLFLLLVVLLLASYYYWFKFWLLAIYYYYYYYYYYKSTAPTLLCGDVDNICLSFNYFYSNSYLLLKCESDPDPFVDYEVRVVTIFPGYY